MKNLHVQNGESCKTSKGSRRVCFFNGSDSRSLSRAVACLQKSLDFKHLKTSSLTSSLTSSTASFNWKL